MPSFLSSFLRQTRTSLLVLLVLVLPLQGVVQLVAGIQEHRHMHTGAARSAAPAHDSALSMLTQPLRAVLDHLHAAQDPRLTGPTLSWTASSGPAAGMHRHGNVFHKHSADTHDVVDVSDAADDAAHGGATAFLAWIPSGLALMAGEGGDRPASAPAAWRDRVVAPLPTPPRG